MTPTVSAQIIISIVTILLSAGGSFIAAYLGVVRGLVIAQNDIAWLKQNTSTLDQEFNNFKNDVTGRLTKLEALSFRRQHSGD